MSSFKTTVQVRFGQVDPAGIAYFPRIFSYIHDVFEEVWEQHVGQRYYYLLLEKKVGFPLVHSDVDFRRPLHFGDRPEVSVTCFKLGRSALGLRYRVSIDDELCVDARMTTVCVELPEMKSISMPTEFRERFEEIMEPL
jgi:4-hydroxybenzoyl-CoA thioesterase